MNDVEPLRDLINCCQLLEILSEYERCLEYVIILFYGHCSYFRLVFMKSLAADVKGIDCVSISFDNIYQH